MQRSPYDDLGGYDLSHYNYFSPDCLRLRSLMDPIGFKVAWSEVLQNPDY